MLLLVLFGWLRLFSPWTEMPNAAEKWTDQDARCELPP